MTVTVDLLTNAPERHINGRAGREIAVPADDAPAVDAAAPQDPRGSGVSVVPSWVGDDRPFLIENGHGREDGGGGFTPAPGNRAFHAFARFQEAAVRTHWPLLCFSGEAIISNAAGLTVMPLLNQASLREQVHMVASDEAALSWTMALTDGRTARIEFETISDRSITTGVLVRIHEIDSARAESLTSLPGLVGLSLPWRAAVRDATTAVRSGRATLVVGERGSGKTSLARAAMSWLPTNGTQAPIRVLDCAMLSAQVHQAASDPGPIGEALDDGESHLLLAHVDAMPQAWHFLIQPFLDRLSDSGRMVWCTTTSTIKQLSTHMATDSFDHVVQVPPLRHRTDDIPLIVDHILHSTDDGGISPPIAPEVVQMLMRYRWPHNVAQLVAILRGVAVKAAGPRISVTDLPLYIQRESARTRLTPYEASEADVIRNALKVCEGNKSSAADLLGISRSTLYRKVKRYDLEFRRQT